jgi:hypothetical protein
MKHLSSITLGCLPSNPTLRELNVQFYPQLQVFLVDHLHKWEFISLLINTPLDIMQARLRSCVGQGVGVWLLTHPTTPTFRLSSTHFLTTPCTHFGLPHLT